MDFKWTESIETILGVKRRMNLHSGEELHVPRNLQMIFETSSIEKVKLKIQTVANDSFNLRIFSKHMLLDVENIDLLL